MRLKDKGGVDMSLFRKYLKNALIALLVSSAVIVFSWTALSLNPIYYNPDNLIIDEGGLIDPDMDLLNPKSTANVKQRVRLVFELSYPHESLLDNTYRSLNTEIFDAFPLELPYDDMYISAYAPFIEMSIPDFNEDVLTKLKVLSNQPGVFRIYVDQAIDLEVPSFVEDAQDIHIATYSDHTNQAYLDVVKVGVFEAANGLPNRYSPVFDGLRNFVFHPKSPNNFDGGNRYHRHGNQVAEIIAETFGSNEHLELYFAPTSVGFFEGIDWFIDQDVDIVNMSFSHVYSVGEYQHRTRYMDYVTYHHQMMFVTASGNRGQYDAFVPPPATGFNSLTVGAVQIEQDEANQIKYRLASYSSYRLQESLMNSKPNMVAIGSTESLGLAGTSFAAPRIAAELGKLMSKHPEMKSQIALWMAIMHAASSDTDFIVDYQDQDLSGLDDKVGAGIFQGQYAQDIIAQNRFGYHLVPSTQQSAVALEIERNRVWLHAGDLLTISIASIVDIQQMSNQPFTTTPLMSDYVIYLFKDGRLIQQSLGLSNIEMMRYIVPDEESGFYDIVIHRRFGIVQTYEDQSIGIAYRIE